MAGSELNYTKKKGGNKRAILASPHCLESSLGSSLGGISIVSTGSESITKAVATNFGEKHLHAIHIMPK